ncbi:MAG TPA: Rieske (2Fe-2S) protein, partial [Reyranellaceae bacterium]|nr:Rieske (2Fe-2S) protein [Reyranellaceae bacterium]
MKHADQVAYIERMLGMARANARDDGQLSYTAVEEYFDERRFEREKEVLFRNYPIVVGFSAQLRKPGDFITNSDTGQNVLVTRGMDGKLRAFLNVCRHRSATVELKPCGSNKRAFVCPYHGWSYDLSGRLVGITDGAWFGEVDKSTHGLRPLAVAERCGLVWVVPKVLEAGQSPHLDIDSFLGPVNDDLKTWDMQ